MVLVLTKNTQWKFGTRKGFLKRPERGNDRNNEEFVKCRCKMPCSLPSSLARSATKSRQFTPDGQGQFLRRDDDGRSVGRSVGPWVGSPSAETVRKTQNERPSRLRRLTVRVRPSGLSPPSSVEFSAHPPSHYSSSTNSCWTLATRDLISIIWSRNRM